MTEKTVSAERKFGQATTKDEIFALREADLQAFSQVIDTNDKNFADVPGEASVLRPFILGNDVFLVQPDGSIVLLLGANKADLILNVDGQAVSVTKLGAVTLSEIDWSVLGDVPTLKINDVLEPGSAQPSAGSEDPVQVGDPLIGLNISPLLPFTEYTFPDDFDRDSLGDEGGSAPGVTEILIEDTAFEETDGPLVLRFGDFVSLAVEDSSSGEEITNVTLRLEGLPVGTAASDGRISIAGPTGVLTFSGSLSDFENLEITLPTDFSTDSRTDTLPGPITGTVTAETNFLGATTSDFPITVAAEGDAEIDDTLPDTVPDESDAPIDIRPVDLLLPRVTDRDGSESLETLVLTVDGLPAGATLASLGISIPTGATGSIETDPDSGAARLVIEMTAESVADIEAAYASLELTIPADFSTQNRTDLTTGTALPLSFELSIQTDEDSDPDIDTENDGTVTTTRVVDIGFEEDIDLTAPRLIAAAEDGGVPNSDIGVDVALNLQIVIDDADGSETEDPSDPRFAANVSIAFSDIPAGTTVNAGTLTGTAWTGTVAQAEALVLSFPGDFSGTILSVTTVTTPEGDEAISQGIVITPTPDIEISGAIFARETDDEVEVTLSSFIDVLITDPTEELSTLAFVLPSAPDGIRAEDASGNVIGTTTLAADGTVTLEIFFDADSAFTPEDVTLVFPEDYSTESPATTLEAELTVVTIEGGVENDPVTGTIPITVDFEGDIDVDNSTLTLQETDDVVTFLPADSVLPRATDIDGSESITEVAVVFNALPAGARVSLDGGGSFSPATGAYAFTGTLAEYQDLAIELPRDYSTENPATTLTADISAITDEGGFGFGTLDITVLFELDVTLTAPPTVNVVEDGDGVDGLGVTADLGITIAVTDTDGSEDSTTVEISFTDMPEGVFFNGGDFDADTGLWTGTVANANALTVVFPGDFSGDIDAVISAISPEGRVDVAQVISVEPAGDIDFVVTELVAAETDSAVVVTPSDAWEVLISDLDPNLPLETVEEITLTLNDVPAGVIAAGVPAGTITYDVATGGTFVFTGTEAEYAALTLSFPADFSTESPVGDGLTIDGTLAATSTEDAAGQSTPVSLRITPEGDVTIDTSLPDTVPDESDGPTPLRPADLVLPVLTDGDGSESLESLQLTITGLPADSTVASLGLSLPAGAISSIVTDAETGAATLVITLTAAAVGDVGAAYDVIDLALPADFSTANRSDLTNGDVSLPLALQVDVQTDEDVDAADDSPFDGTASATRIVEIGFELDVDLDVPATLTGVEDGDGTGVTLDLGISAVATDADGSEDGAIVEIAYTDIPDGVTFNGGTYDPDTGIWTGTLDEASALTLTLPENYSGEFSSTITVISPEGRTDTTQVITIEPSGDITFDVDELVAQETDATVTVLPSSAWQVTVSDTESEVLDSVNLTLNDLPAGVIITGVPDATITYDAGLGGTLSFTGTEAEYMALSLSFPVDFSTESPDAGGATITGTLFATSNEDAIGDSSPVVLRITPEGDAEIDDTLPDTVPDESDAPTVVAPSSLLAPQVTDIDGSEAIEELTLTVSGLPGGSDLATLGITLSAGVTASISDDPANGSATLIVVMDAATVADIEATYAAFELTLPADFSTANRSDLTTGDTALSLSFQLDIQTDEDQDAGDDTGTDGTVTAIRTVEIGAEEDITLTVPSVITAQEDGGDPGDPDLGVDVDLGIVIEIDDADGSETKDSTDPRFAAQVSVRFVDLPDGAGVNGGTLTGDTWTGTAAEAEALVLSFPGDYNGTVLSVITVTTPEGSESTSQTIVIEPTPDIVIDGFVNVTETDAPLEVLLTDFITVTVGGGETLSALTFDLAGLPDGVTAVDDAGNPVGTIIDNGDGTADFLYTFADGDAVTPDQVRLVLPQDYSTTNPAQTLVANISASTESGTVSETVDFIVTAEGDVEVGDGSIALVETDAVVTFKPADEITPIATDIDGSESIETIAVVFNALPTGARFSTDNGATFATASPTLAFTGTPAEYAALVIELPADFSTENPNTTLSANVTATTDEGGTATGALTVTVDAEGDIALSGPGTISLTENDAPGDTDEDATSQIPLDFRPADALNAASPDADGSEEVATVDVTVNGLPAGARFSTDNGLTFVAVTTGASITLNGLSAAEYEGLVFRLPDDFSTVADITGSATFTTDEALLAGESDPDSANGIETGSFSVSIASEQDVQISADDISRIEDFGAPIPLNLDTVVTDIDGSETITGISVVFDNLPAGTTLLNDGVSLTGPSDTWTGDIADLRALEVVSLPEHFSGIIDITVTVDTDEGSPAGTSETFQLNITPVAEPTIELSVDDSAATVDAIGADNFIVDEDASFLLLIDAATSDTDGSEALTEIVIENLPAGWVPSSGGVVDLTLFEADAAKVAGASVSGNTLTITLEDDVTEFHGSLRVAPRANDDRDVDTILGADLVATVTSQDMATGLPTDTATASDGVDVDVDAVVDGILLETSDRSQAENRGGVRRLNINLNDVELEDDDGSETITGLDLTISVATLSDGFDPADTSDLLLRVRGGAFASDLSIVQSGSTADSVSYEITPAGGVSNDEFAEAIGRLQLVTPQHFSGVLTLDGTVFWNETSTGDVENDASDNFASEDFQITQTVRPLAEADLTASVFVRSIAEVASGSDTIVSVSVEDGSVSSAEILTLLESTSDGSGPGQVELFVGLDASTPDTDGSEQLTTLVVENVPSDWVRDVLSGTSIDDTAFFTPDGILPLGAAELAKIASAEFDAGSGDLTLTFVDDVTEFAASLQLTPTLYEDYDADRADGDSFSAAGDFFAEDLRIVLTAQDGNTATTDGQVSDARFDVDVDPVNNFATILTLPTGNEAEIDAAGGIFQIPFEPVIQDQDGSETVTAVVLREIPTGVTVYVPDDPSDPTGPKSPALLTSVNSPPGFNSWSLSNEEWLGAELRGIPEHFAGDFELIIDVITTEADGRGTRITTLDESFTVQPSVDGGDPSETLRTEEDTAVQVVIDGNIIDNSTNSPDSPEVLTGGVLITNIRTDSEGRLPEFFEGPPGPIPTGGTAPLNQLNIVGGEISLTAAQAANLWVRQGQDSNETVRFDVTVTYAESIDASETTTGTGTVTINVTGIADDPVVTVQDAASFDDPSRIDDIFRPDETVDGIPNSERIYGYAGFDSGPFELDSRLRDSVIGNGNIPNSEPGTFTDRDVVSLSGQMTEILVPEAGPTDFDGSETLYYLIQDVPDGVAFAGASPVDTSGETYLFTESQLANLQFVPTGVSEPTFYDLQLSVLVVEDDQTLPPVDGRPTDVVLAEIAALPGGAVETVDFTIVVVPDPGGSGTVDCTPEQNLPLPDLTLVSIGSQDEDTQQTLQIQLTPNAFYDSIADLASLPAGVVGSFGLGIEVPAGATLTASPSSGVVVDPVTGLYVIDLAALGVSDSDPTLTEGALLFTPPPNESSPTNPFDAADTFGGEDPYDGLDSLSYSVLLNNFTCGTTLSATREFPLTIDPVADGPTIVLAGGNSFLEDTSYDLNLEISGIDEGERPTGDVVISLDGASVGQVLDASGNPITGVETGGVIAYTVALDAIEDLSLTAAEHYSGPLMVTVQATSEDIDGSTQTTTLVRTIDVIAVADTGIFDFDDSEIDPDTGLPFLDLSGAVPTVTAVEDTEFLLSSVLMPSSPDADGSEVVSFVLAGVPDYLEVTGPGGAGFIDNGDGSFTISPDAWLSVSVKLVDEHARLPDALDATLPSEIPLTVTVNTLELANSDDASAVQDLILRVRPDADMPSVLASIDPVTGTEEDDGTAYVLALSGNTPDPHETMAFEVTVPAGGKIFVDGVEQPASGGIVTLTGVTGPDGMDFTPSGTVTFEAPADFGGTIDLQVTAVTSDSSVDGSFTDSSDSTPAALSIEITSTPDLELTVSDDAPVFAETDDVVSVQPSDFIDIAVTDTDGSETVNNVTFRISDVPDGTMYLVGSGPAVAVTGDLVFSGTLADFEMLQIVVPQDFATNGTPLLGSIDVTTNESGAETAAFQISVTGELDVSLTVDPPADALAQSGAPLDIDLGIVADITDVQLTPSETLEEVVVDFSTALPAGTTVSAGVLSGARLTLTRGVTSPADFALMVAMLSITVPGSFSGAVAGEVTATTNHGVSGAEAFDIAVNDQPEIGDPVDITSNEAVFFIAFDALLMNADDPDAPLSVENVTSSDALVTVTEQTGGVEISTPDGFVGAVTLTYDVVDSNVAPARAEATADLSIDTLQMIVEGTVTGPDGVTRDLLSDVTGAAGGTDIARGTDGDDGVIATATNYDEIEAFDLLGGSDFIDLSAATRGFDVSLGAGDDWAIGSDTADVLRGDAGADVLQGGGGSDTLEGGSDADIFVLTDLIASDVISDYEAPSAGGTSDQIDLTALVSLDASESLVDQVTYDSTTGDLAVGGASVATVNVASGGFASDVEVIFNNASGAQETAVV